MERYYAGLDVSKDETAICVRDHDGKAVLATKKPTDPATMKVQFVAE